MDYLSLMTLVLSFLLCLYVFRKNAERFASFLYTATPERPVATDRQICDSMKSKTIYTRISSDAVSSVGRPASVYAIDRTLTANRSPARGPSSIHLSSSLIRPGPIPDGFSSPSIQPTHHYPSFCSPKSTDIQIKASSNASHSYEPRRVLQHRPQSASDSFKKPHLSFSRTNKRQQSQTSFQDSKASTLGPKRSKILSSNEHTMTDVPATFKESFRVNGRSRADSDDQFSLEIPPMDVDDDLVYSSPFNLAGTEIPEEVEFHGGGNIPDSFEPDLPLNEIFNSHRRLSRLHTHRRPELDDMLFDDDEIRLKFQRNDKEVLDILKAFESKVEESRFSQQDETVSPQKSTTPSCSTPSFPPQPVHLQAADGVVAQPQLNEKSTQPVLTLEQASSQSDARSELSLTSAPEIQCGTAPSQQQPTATVFPVLGNATLDSARNVTTLHEVPVRSNITQAPANQSTAVFVAPATQPTQFSGFSTDVLQNGGGIPLAGQTLSQSNGNHEPSLNSALQNQSGPTPSQPKRPEQPVFTAPVFATSGNATFTQAPANQNAAVFGAPATQPTQFNGFSTNVLQKGGGQGIHPVGQTLSQSAGNHEPFSNSAMENQSGPTPSQPKLPEQPMFSVPAFSASGNATFTQASTNQNTTGFAPSLNQPTHFSGFSTDGQQNGAGQTASAPVQTGGLFSSKRKTSIRRR